MCGNSASEFHALLFHVKKIIHTSKYSQDPLLSLDWNVICFNNTKLLFHFRVRNNKKLSFSDNLWFNFHIILEDSKFDMSSFQDNKFSRLGQALFSCNIKQYSRWWSYNTNFALNVTLKLIVDLDSWENVKFRVFMKYILCLWSRFQMLYFQLQIPEKINFAYVQLYTWHM